ncbi:DEAD/DEAH box helicase [Persicobacter diffluens]|uniref:Helicase n=1 Tax=Persicobacter diffluens TaxID=981 RepID=A0AAN4VXL7_9BACT|nr:helicase [Persicobacter diffluens]
MAKRTIYGKTPWGKQWLQSLEAVDFSNRLPRGRSYAGRGMVKDIQINGRKILAKVAGSRPRPYKVDIEIPQISPTVAQQIDDKIREEKLWQVALANQQFAPEFLEWLDTIKGVFPKKWDDWKMNCSCPDWAVPCKHLASVIYELSQEIDRNPLLLFSLIGYETPIQINETDDQYHHQWTDFCQEEENTIDPPIAFKLHEIKTDGIGLIDMLASTPPFYHKDFKKELVTFYKSVKKIRFTEKDGEEEKSELFQEFRKTGNISLELSERAELSAVAYQIEDTHILINADGQAFIAFLDEIHPADLPAFHPKIQWLQKAYMLAKHLVQLQLIRPALWQQKGAYSILWGPMRSEPTVEAVLEALTHELPAGLIDLEPKKHPQLTAKGKLHALMCFLVEALIQPALEQAPDTEDIDHLFFRKSSFSFDRLEHQSIPEAIALWLRPWEGLKKTEHYLLQIEDKMNWLEIRLKIAPLNHLELAQPLIEALKLDLPIKVLQNLEWLHRRWAPLAKLWKAPSIQFENDPLALQQLLLEILPELERLGMELQLDKSLRTIIRPQLSMRVDSSSTRIQSFFSMDDLFSFNWQMALGEQLVDPEEFFRQTENMQGIVRLKDQYVFIQSNEIEKIKKRLEKIKAPKPVELLQIALSGKFEGTTVERTENLITLIENLKAQQSLDTPALLLAELRPYQLDGYHWLYKNAKLGMGSILADDMGLGKTLQAITFLLKLKEEQNLHHKQPALIVLPTGLLSNWAHELQRFAPSLNFRIFHGQDAIEGDFDLLLTSYGMLRNKTPLFKKIKWQVMIIDEAQAIKNSNTAQSKAVRSISAKIKIALSGTPVENSLSEYWSIMDFANKGYLGGLTAFKKNFVKPIELKQDQDQLAIFREISAPFIKRRLKTDKSIISDLPDKIEENRYVNLSPEQSSLYEAVLAENMEKVRSLSGIERKGMVLNMITALKQICNHPAQYTKSGSKESNLSGKAEVLLPLVQEVIQRGEKIIIFTQYRTAGELMQHWISEHLGLDANFLHGGCSRKERDHMVDQFQQNPDHKILLLSLKAAGTGLNLVAASHVIHFDLWWNPAVESQATDRAFRIGQKQNVMVHRFIATGTFEEKINEMINSKKDLADKVMEGNAQKWLGEMSDQELDDFFKLNKNLAV